MQKKSYALSLLAAGCAVGVASTAQAALLSYEPFNYTVGQAIAGQSNTTSNNSPISWLLTGTATSPVHQVGTGNLTSPLPGDAGVGGMGLLENADETEIDKLHITGSGGASTTLFYSMLLNVPSTGLSNLTIANTNQVANNDFLAGFGNTLSTTEPNSWAGELTIRKGSASSTFDLGIHASNGAGANSGWSGDLSPSTTYLIVVEYAQGATPGAVANGTNMLWVNPVSTSYGGTPPTSTASFTGTINASGSVDSVASFMLGAGIAAKAAPAVTDVDDIRIGTTWADVTSVPEPFTAGFMGIVALGALMRRHRAC